MERGTGWEREAVRERWTAMERQRRAATRLAGSLCLLFTGLLPLLIARASGQEICLAAAGLPGIACDGVIPESATVPLVMLGGALIAGGLWGCWTVFRE